MKKHRIDALFPILLFGVLTVFALLVIVLSAKIYKNTTDNSYRNHQSRIALSYVSEKIHQLEGSQVSLTKIEEMDALKITQTHNDTQYHTYIYFYDGAIRELFIKENTSVSLIDGKEILKVSDFSMKQVEENLLYFLCTDTQNHQANSYVRIVP